MSLNHSVWRAIFRQPDRSLNNSTSSGLVITTTNNSLLIIITTAKLVDKLERSIYLVYSISPYDANPSVVWIFICSLLRVLGIWANEHVTPLLCFITISFSGLRWKISFFIMTSGCITSCCCSGMRYQNELQFEIIILQYYVFYESLAAPTSNQQKSNEYQYNLRICNNQHQPAAYAKWKVR